MSSINWGRVIFGGLLAGVVINVVEFFLNGVEVTPFFLNVYSRRILAIGLTVGLAEVLLATLFGAWLYREPSSA